MTNSTLLKAASGFIAFMASSAIAISVQAQTITIYSGRTQSLIGPLLEQAKKELGIDIRVRYGDTSQLAIAILEEGNNSPADIFFAQDAGALGALEKQGKTAPISAALLDQVDNQFRSPNGQWIGISGRARVINYNTRMVSSGELPNSIWDLTQPKWRGKVAWAPTNGSFQSFVTAMRLMEGDAKTLEWLKAMKANGTKVYSGNTAIVQGLGRGEVAIGLVNNYYLPTIQRTNPNIPVGVHYTQNDAGSIINIAGVSVLKSSKNKEAAERLIGYLLRPTAQSYFAKETNEYPLRKRTPGPTGQPALRDIKSPNINLSNLADLPGTLKLLKESGVL
jgi:iron(III) transport system substrate-binding protein